MALRYAAFLSCLLMGLLSAQAEEVQSFGLSSSLVSPRQDFAIAQPRKLQAGVNCASVCATQPRSQVCAADKKTYENACVPVCQGKKIAYYGACAAKPCLCAPFYAPVCGGGKTYLNSCFATCAGAKSTTSGVCSSDCACGSSGSTVCGQDGKEYASECKAACAGAALPYSGTCDDRIGACKCANTVDPICVTNTIETKLPTGQIYKTPYNVTYQNPCMATCDGADIKTGKKGLCSDFVLWNSQSWWCNCPMTLKPVCAQGPLNITTTLYSECTAKCLGYKVLSQGVCTSNCLCPMKVKPVCANGKTYRTACDARCKGKATTWKAGPCTACSACPKPNVMNPMAGYVCGDNGISYANSCLAECEGVTVKSKGFCGMPSAGK